MFKTLRVVVLLTVLLIVGGSAWLTKLRTTSWERPLRVAVFPIDADDSQATQRYTRALTADTFRPIADFMKEEAARYGLPLAIPIEMYLAPEIKLVPPPPPKGGNLPQIMFWSLRMRYWAWVNGEFSGPKPDVRMFVLYHDPERTTRVSHSLGLQKGLIGVVNAFASEEQTPENNVIIAHELLHTVGATDKYDSDTNQPSFPDGYAEPEREPRLPQRYAEIMAGRMPISSSDADIPRGLDHVLIGAKTAGEISWVR